MELKGKLLCGLAGLFFGDLLGLPLGGLIGFVLGSFLGHYFFDKPKEAAASDQDYKAYQRRQGAFIYHVFRLCAKVAKVDGAVNTAEVGHMERLMRQQFRMSDRGRQQAIRVWTQSKDSHDPFEQFALAFYTDFGRERHHVLNMMDMLFATAAADGGLHPREEELLLRAAGIFHIGRLQYDRIKSRYFQAPPRHQHRQHYGRNPLEPYYSLLGAQPQDSLDTIKQKFRSLAKQWHPDKLTAKGASPEALRHAKEKFQQINEAWNKIEEARKN